MNFIDLTEENIQAYDKCIPPAIFKELGRKYYRGLAGEDAATDELSSIIVWELKNLDNEEVATEAELLWFATGDPEEGKVFLTEWEKRLKDENVSRVYFELAELGENEKTVLTESGFFIEVAEGRDIRVSMMELASLKLPRKKIPDYICSLSQLTYRQFKAGIMTAVFCGRYGLLEDIPYLPVERYDLEFSSVVMTDGKANGLLLVHGVEDGVYCVELLFALQPDANINLLYMITHSVVAATMSRLPNDIVIIRRHSEAVLKLTNKLFPQKKGEMVKKGEKRL